MVSDALNNYMLENKHTTATVVPAFNRVQRRPPSNRYIISISWVSKMENQSQVYQLGAMSVGGLGCFVCHILPLVCDCTLMQEHHSAF